MRAAPVITKPAAPPPATPRPVPPKPAPVVAQDVDGIAVGDSAALHEALEEESHAEGPVPPEQKPAEEPRVAERFEKPPVAAGAIVCRFCRGPLDLAGDFCEQCGAPLEDAVPPGTVLKRKPKPAPPAAPPGPPLAVPPPEPAAAPPALPPTPARPAAPPRPEASAPASSLSGARLAVPPPEGAKTPKPPPPRSGTAPSTPKPPTPPPKMPAEFVQAIQAATEDKTRVAMAPLAVPGAAAAPPKKAFPVVPVAGGVVLLLALAGGGFWYFTRGSQPQPAPPVVAPPPKPAEQPAPPPEAEQPAPETAPSETVAPTKRAAKPAPAPASAASAGDAKASQIANFQNLAREAYTKGNYADPADTSAIAYCQKVLALDPANAYAKTLLENSVNGGKYQVHQAITKKDFAEAHRVSDTMAKLLPGRTDVAGLKEDIATAERAAAGARAPAAAAATVSFRAYHMHSGKSPADNGPFCLGTLSVAGGNLRYAGESASAGQATDRLEFACADVREIKKNARVASRQNGFHVRTSSTNVNFVPEDSSATHISALAAACGK